LKRRLPGRRFFFAYECDLIRVALELFAFRSLWAGGFGGSTIKRIRP